MMKRRIIRSAGSEETDYREVHQTGGVAEDRALSKRNGVKRMTELRLDFRVELNVLEVGEVARRVGMTEIRDYPSLPDCRLMLDTRLFVSSLMMNRTVVIEAKRKRKKKGKKRRETKRERGIDKHLRVTRKLEGNKNTGGIVLHQREKSFPQEMTGDLKEEGKRDLQALLERGDPEALEGEGIGLLLVQIVEEGENHQVLIVGGD